MKTYKLILALSVLALSGFSQNLTPAQKQDEAQHLAALRPAVATAASSGHAMPAAVQAELAAMNAQMAQMEAAPKPVPHLTKKAAAPVVNTMAVAAPQEATGGDGQDATADCGCNCPVGNPQPYGLPTFANWNHDSLIVNQTYPWYLQNTELHTWTNGYGARSYYGYSEPNIAGVRSAFFTIATNHYDVNGDPLAHQLSFWYYFDQLSGSNDKFRCFVGVNPADDTGKFNTNLPASSWRHAVVTVPPFINYSNAPMLLIFATWKVGTITYTGSTAYLDPYEFSWCPIPTPTPTTGDFWVRRGTNSVNVGWNTLAYRTNRWALQFTPYLGGIWSTNVQAPLFTNNTASVTFANTNGMRYYRLVRL